MWYEIRTNLIRHHLRSGAVCAVLRQSHSQIIERYTLENWIFLRIAEALRTIFENILEGCTVNNHKSHILHNKSRIQCYVLMKIQCRRFRPLFSDSEKNLKISWSTVRLGKCLCSNFLIASSRESRHMYRVQQITHLVKYYKIEENLRLKKKIARAYSCRRTITRLACSQLSRSSK